MSSSILPVRTDKSETFYIGDAFSNPLTKTGADTRNPMNATKYVDLMLTRDPIQLEILYKSNWMVKRVVDIVAEDKTKNWFTISSSEVNLEQLKKLEKIISKTQLRKQLTEGDKWGRLYGGAVGIIKLANYAYSDMSQPLMLDYILPDSYKGLLIVDRWSGIEPDFNDIDNDIASDNFGLPRYYYFCAEDGRERIKIHHSWIIRFIGDDVPGRKRFVNDCWGYSILESILEPIMHYENVLNNMNSLTAKASLQIMKIEGLGSSLTTAPNPLRAFVAERLAAMSDMQSNLGFTAIDKDEELIQNTYNFNGFSDVMAMNQNNVAGAAQNIVSRIFSRSANGLNNTGEADMKMYGEYIDSEVEYNLRPIVEKLLPIIAKSTWGWVPKEIEVIFPPYVSPDESQEAVILERKIGILLDMYRTGAMPKNILMEEAKKAGTELSIMQSLTQEIIEQGQDIWYVNGVEGDLQSILQAEEDEEETAQEEDDPEQETTIVVDGGIGSGNFGHGGRPGEVGGAGTTMLGNSTTEAKAEAGFRDEPETRVYNLIKNGERVPTPFETQLIEYLEGERQLDGEFKTKIDSLIGESDLSTTELYRVVDKEFTEGIEPGKKITLDTDMWTLTPSYAQDFIEVDNNDEINVSLLMITGPHKALEIKTYSPYIGRQEAVTNGTFTVLETYDKYIEGVPYTVVNLIDEYSIAEFEAEGD